MSPASRASLGSHRAGRGARGAGGGGSAPQDHQAPAGCLQGQPQVWVQHPECGGGGGSSLGFVNKNIYFAFYRCLYRTAQSLRRAGAGPTGSGGPSSGSGGIRRGGHTNTGEECIEAFRGGGAETFILHQLPQGLDPPVGGGRGLESGTEPLSGWGEVVAKGGPNPAPPPRQRGAGAQCAWCCRAGGAGATKGGGRAPCHGEEGAQGRRGPQGRPPTAGVGFSAESVPGPEASGGAASAALTPSLFTRICSPRAASAPQCSWIWGVPGGIPAPGSR